VRNAEHVKSRRGGGGGALCIQAPHSLNGPRGLTLGRPEDPPMALILDYPQSFTGPVHMIRGQLILNYPRALHPDSPIHFDGGTLPVRWASTSIPR
jgi:hypothetical protein